jgi:hypothetical protein
MKLETRKFRDAPGAGGDAKAGESELSVEFVECGGCAPPVVVLVFPVSFNRPLWGEAVQGSAGRAIDKKWT